VSAYRGGLSPGCNPESGSFLREVDALDRQARTRSSPSSTCGCAGPANTGRAKSRRRRSTSARSSRRRGVAGAPGGAAHVEGDVAVSPLQIAAEQALDAESIRQTELIA